MGRLAAVAATLLALRLIVFDVGFCEDDITHWLIARRALSEPWFFLNIWGRPGFTILHALPSTLGFGACRALSALLSFATAFIVARLCGQRGRLPALLGFAACFFQPQFYYAATGALTETVYAFVAALALALTASGQVRWACLALSWGAMTRLEGMPMLPVYWFALVLDGLRRPLDEQPTPREHVLRLLLLGLFPLAWNLLYAAALDFESWLPIFSRNEFVEAPNAFYGHGRWYSYLIRAWNIHGPLLFPFVFFGCFVLLRKRRTLVPLAVLTFWLMQSVLWAGGFMRTGGYDRFFVAITPFAAIAAVEGILAVMHTAKRRLSRRGRRRALTGALALTVLWCAVIDGVWTAERQHHDDAVVSACEVITATGGVSSARPLLTDAVRARARFVQATSHASAMKSLTRANLEAAAVGTRILVTGIPGHENSLPLLDFYDAEQGRLVRGMKGVDRLEGLDADRLLPRYRQLADTSVLGYWFAPTSRSSWPRYVKVFEVVEAPR